MKLKLAFQLGSNNRQNYQNTVTKIRTLLWNWFQPKLKIYVPELKGNMPKLPTRPHLPLDPIPPLIPQRSLSLSLPIEYQRRRHAVISLELPRYTHSRTKAGQVRTGREERKRRRRKRYSVFMLRVPFRTFLDVRRTEAFRSEIARVSLGIFVPDFRGFKFRRGEEMIVF